MSTSPRVVVVGVGAIGGTISAALGERGVSVTAISSNPQVYAAVERYGFRVRSSGSERVVLGRIAHRLEGFYDLCVLATQPQDVEEAARVALPHVDRDGVFVVLQNGLCEERVAKVVGSHRVVGAIVAWGASMPEPGVYERTAVGGWTIGAYAGASARDIAHVGDVLRFVGPVSVTDNLAGARWSKLALNCAVSAIGTIAGERLGSLILVRRYRRLALEVMSEAVAVGLASGVDFEKIGGTVDLRWVALTDADRTAWLAAALVSKHALLAVVGLRYRRLRSSMLAAMERGRRPAIDFLNGEIVSRGARLGVPTPFNQAICDTVWAISRGEAQSSRAVLDSLCD